MGISGGGPHWSNASLKTNTSTDFAKDFHIFELNWTEEFLAFSVDGEEIYRQASQTGTKEYRQILRLILFRLAAPGPPGGLFDYAGLPGENIWVSGGPMAPFDTDFHFIISAQSGENHLRFNVHLVQAFLGNEVTIPKILKHSFPCVVAVRVAP